jgi:hypothetical protein
MREARVADKESLTKKSYGKLNDSKFTLEQWDKIYGQKAFGAKTASLSKIAANKTRYLLSHATIMASVAVEPEPEDWLIKPESSHTVNNNEDAWSNDVLALSYKTFIGSFNFVEHYQNSKHAKGHILDSVLRKVQLTPETWIYFCDILVATDRKHEELTEGILGGKVRYMSMGCVTDLVTCSYCGKQVKEGDRYCVHLQFQKGQFLPDNDGIDRRVAELCGNKSLPGGGVRFVEASWVAVPAFPGAALRNVVDANWIGPGTKYTTEADLGNKAASQSKVKDPEGPSAADFKRQFKS